MRSVQQIVEEVLETGRRPEEICGDDSELLREVLDRLRRIRDLEAALETMFPEPDIDDDAQAGGAVAPDDC